MACVQTTEQPEETAEVTCVNYHNPGVIALLLDHENNPEVTASYLQNIHSLAMQTKAIVVDLKAIYVSRDIFCFKFILVESLKEILFLPPAFYRKIIPL